MNFGKKIGIILGYLDLQFYLCDRFIGFTLKSDSSSVREYLKVLFHMENFKFYTSPDMEILEISVERGYIISGDLSGSDYGDGGEGTPMD